MKIMHALALAALFLILGCTAAFSESMALLIGCDHFLSLQDTYPASHHNAESMASALGSLREPPTVTVVMPDGLDSAEALAHAMTEAYSTAGEADTCIFYISTHGIWEAGEDAGDFRFLLSDGTSEVQVTARQLKTMLDAFPARKLLILDACHSGAVIGKGVPLPAENLFTGDRYLVLCSSGGTEDSWYWSSGDGTDAGSGFFTDCLVRGISSTGNAAADENLDHAVTLDELHRYLLRSHGASCAQAYPEVCEDEIFRLPERQRVNRGALLQRVCFGSGALSIASPAISLSFTVLQPTRVAYQLVYQRGGSWDFDHALLIWDQPELPGQLPGSLEPGYKERTISLRTRDEDYGEGYVLLQVLAVRGSRTVVGASTVLCIPPADGDPQLRVRSVSTFNPSVGEEACIFVEHAIPCELSVRVIRSDGTTAARLMTNEPTRPQQLIPSGTTITWNGRLRDGTEAPDGDYTIRVTAVVGDEIWEADDVTIRVSREPNAGGQTSERTVPVLRRTRVLRDRVAFD